MKVTTRVGSGDLRAIVVAPQGARVPDSDPEYLDWSPTDDWPKAIAQQLTACVDARFDTIDSRRGRALVGLSAGGYGALNIGLRSLATFGAVESWSGYPVATDPSGYHVLKLSGPAARAAAAQPPWIGSTGEQTGVCAVAGSSALSMSRSAMWS